MTKIGFWAQVLSNPCPLFLKPSLFHGAFAECGKKQSCRGKKKQKTRDPFSTMWQLVWRVEIRSDLAKKADCFSVKKGSFFVHFGFPVCVRKKLEHKQDKRGERERVWIAGGWSTENLCTLSWILCIWTFVYAKGKKSYGLWIFGLFEKYERFVLFVLYGFLYIISSCIIFGVSHILTV